MTFFQTVIDWLTSFWGWVLAGATWCLHAIGIAIKFLIFTVLDGFFLIIEALFSSLNLVDVTFNYSAAWAGLPTQLIWLISAVGLPHCFAMLGAAYLIRLTLNLIPSWASRV